MASRTVKANSKPPYVAALEAAYGAPSQAGFGSAVFYEQIDASGDLEKAALKYYQHFVGDLWERWGEDAWMGPWKQVYARETGAQRDIIAELKGIGDSYARLSVPVVLDVAESSDPVGQALSDVYDDPAVTELSVFALGDGGAMSGLLVAGRRKAGEATFLVFLMD